MNAGLRGFAGAVLRVSPAGIVVESNGCLERTLGRDVTGRSLASLLDPGSSRAKWRSLLGVVPAIPEGTVTELILLERGTLGEPRTFSAAWDGEDGSLWLVEHPRDPRRARLEQEAAAVNAEMVQAQRELVRDRARLARAHAELEAAYREAERLNRVVQEQNAELERSNRDLDAFAHVVSHDLKAPLRAIGNYAAWIEEDLEGQLQGESRAHMDLLRSRVRRLERLIDGVLAYARVARERGAPGPVDVGALVRETVELLDPPAGVEVEVGEGMPTLRADRTALEQVFLNLLGNALKYGRPAAGTPRVAVTARGEDGAWVFTVRDNGPGIPPRYRERVWTLFNTGAAGDGADATGIGLAVVRRLVEAHGGSVSVDEAEGGGAAFHVRWPGEA
jgi:signal transduction histidine kinase